MKRALVITLRILVAAAGIAFIAQSVPWSTRLTVPAGVTTTQETLTRESTTVVEVEREDVFVTPLGDIPQATPGLVVEPGLKRLLRRADHSLLWLGFLITAPMYLAATLRWLRLLRTRRFDVRAMKAFELTMLGNFFNFCLPGITSGDVIKAWYASRGTDRRTDAVGTVVADRLAGLAGLALLGIVAGLAAWHDPLAKRLTMTVGGAALGGLLLLALVLTPGVRRTVGRVGIVRRLGEIGLIARLDAVLMSWRNERRALLEALALSLCVHAFLTGGTALAGRALGLDVPYSVLLTVLPVLFLAATVPLTWQGLGVMEALAFALLPHVAPAQIVGMLLASRLFRVIYALLGAYYLTRGDLDLHAAKTSDGSDAP